MRYIQLIIFITLFFFNETRVNAQQTLEIHLKDNIEVRKIPLKNGEFEASDTIKSLTIVFPDDNFTKYTLTFNHKSTDSTKRFTLGFAEGRSVKVLLTDIQDGRLELGFNMANLVKVGKRPVEGKPIIGGKLYLKIMLDTVKEDTKKTGKELCDGAPEAVGNKEIPLSEANCPIDPLKFYCKAMCPGCEVGRAKAGLKDTCLPHINHSPYNELFLPPCLDKNGHALSHSYEVIYDTRKGKNPITYLEVKKNTKGPGEFLKIIKEGQFNPKRGEGVVVRVIGADTVDYKIEYEGELLYLDQQEDFTKAMAAALAPVGDSANEQKEDTNAGTDTATTKDKQVENKQVIDKLHDLDNAAKVLSDRIDAGLINLKLFEQKGKEIAIELAAKEKTWMELQEKFALDSAESGGKKFTDAEKILIKKQIKELKDDIKALKDADLLNKTQIALLKEMDAELARQDSIMRSDIDTLTKQLAKLDSTVKAGIVTASANLSCLKADLIALHIALMQFNRDYADISTRETEYADTLLCIRQRIARTFGVYVGSSGEDLRKALTNKIKAEGVEVKFYLELCNLLKGVETEYSLAVSKRKIYGITSQHITIPNDDILNVRFKAGDKDISEKLEWFVKSGFKIDFSGGVFVDGIMDQEVFYRDETFRYKETIDTVDAQGNVQPVYTGNILDTAGRVVAFATKNRPNVSTGLFMHFYSRLNKVVGLGGGFGISTNFVSNFRLLLGGSLLLSTGRNGRIALTAGLGIGNKIILDKSVKGYSARGLDRDQSENKVYDSVYEVPRFASNNDKIPTVNSVGVSGFFGFSYNFATVSPKKK